MQKKFLSPHLTDAGGSILEKEKISFENTDQRTNYLELCNFQKGDIKFKIMGDIDALFR